MEKDAYEFLSNQANTAADKRVVTTENGETFLIGDDVNEYHNSGLAHSALRTHSLQSIVDYVNNHIDRDHLTTIRSGKMFIQIVSPTDVRLLGELDPWGNRETLIEASPVMDDFNFGDWMDREELNIKLQSMFVSPKSDDEDNEKETLLKFIGNYKESNETVANDDGVTQGATIKVSAGNVATVIVPNPVTLKPYRTFTEIDQPASEFIFRMSQGMRGALFEADGGAWRNEALKSIKTYFKNELGAKSPILG